MADKITDIDFIRRQVEQRCQLEAAMRPPTPETAPACPDINDLPIGGDRHGAQLFVSKFCKTFCFDGNRWWFWGGHHWVEDRQQTVLGAAEFVAQHLEHEIEKIDLKIAAETEAGAKEETKFLKFLKSQIQRYIRRYRTDSGRRNLLEMCSHNDFWPLAVPAEKFDQKPWLLACSNGVVNLKTGELQAGRQCDLISRASPYHYDPQMATPHLERFLSDVFVRQDLIDFIRRLLGASLLGPLEYLVFFVGLGRNGKTSLKELLLEILKSLAGVIPSEMLIDNGRARNSAGPSPDIMSLRGLRMVFASETKEGEKLDFGTVKLMTGSDTLTGRWPHDREPVTFKPSHTVFLLTNNRPAAPANDPAFWARVILIDFPTKFVKSPQLGPGEKTLDPRIKEKLLTEAPGILAWLVKGALEYQAAGMDLRLPALVQEATELYRADEDLLGEWLAACCVIEPELQTAAADLYNSFKEWHLESMGKFVPSQRKFSTWLRRKFEYKKGRYIEYLGIGLLVEGQRW